MLPSTLKVASRALFHLLLPSVFLLLFQIAPAAAANSALDAAFPFPSCSPSAALVLGSSVVAVFKSSANCTFPFFPYLAALPSLGSSDAFSVTIIAIGGGGGGGRMVEGAGALEVLLSRPQMSHRGKTSASSWDQVAAAPHLLEARLCTPRCRVAARS